MNKSDIVVGGVYRGVKGAKRLAVAIMAGGKQFRRPGKVRYEHLAFGSEPKWVKAETFARWAVEKVPVRERREKNG